jgi:hypothetical protein
LFWLGLHAVDIQMLLIFMLPASVGLGVFVPVICAAAQSMSPPHMRATAVALTLFACQFFGGVLGPPSLGLLSDTLSSRYYVGAGTYDSVCSHSATLVDACAVARGRGLAAALALWVAGFLWAGVHFLLAARTLPQDRVA